jgi:hypothetical protein
MASTGHFIDVSGSPQERGRQHGEALRGVIADHKRRWAEHVGRQTGLKLADFIDRHLSATDYLRTAERHVPDLVREVHGIAEGASLTFDEAFSLQLMDEEWLFIESMRGQHHCSSLATSDPQRQVAFAAQTMDLPSWMNGSQAILRQHDPVSGRAWLMLTSAGMIALNGMNNAGFAVVVNTLSDLPSSHDGLPVAFVTRGLLDCTSVADARRFLHGIRHAAGQNYILCDLQCTEDYECGAEGVRRFLPAASSGGCVWHTNHVMAGQGEGGDLLAATGGRENSHARMAALDEAFGKTGGATGIAAAKSVLEGRAHAEFPVNRPLDSQDETHGFTFATVIWELAPELRGHAVLGPREAGAFQNFALPPQSAEAA